ncbi:MAG: NAD-dependent epimerase/dehydratase family protein [Phycisphaerales bacterium]
MPITRREFVTTTSLAGAALGLGGASTALASLLQNTQPSRKLNILVLGGTGFIGPHMVERAIERGHTVTLFNRGQTNTHLFPELEKLKGDRDPDVEGGLAALQGREWDAAIDTASFVPRWVNASTSLLADRIGQYVFISSISVYKDGSIHGMTEDVEVGTVEDETREDWKSPGLYGPLKALCEQTASKAMGGRATNIRPGFIVGPRDRALNRFPMWVLRVAKRDEIVAPGTPDDPVQLIDARDLAAFAIHCIEQKTAGTFNAVGPEDQLGVGAMVAGIKKGCGTDPKVTWVSDEFIEKWSSSGTDPEKPNQMPLVPCIPPDSEAAGYGTVSNAKAVAAGMTFRSVEDSARDSLKWIEEGEDPTRRQRMLDFIVDSGMEDGLLEAWKAREDDSEPERQSAIFPQRSSVVIGGTSAGTVQV